MLGKIREVLLSYRFRKIFLIVLSIIFVIQIICGAIAYYCIFNTKIDWEEFSKKFAYIAAFVSNPNVPVDEQLKNNNEKKEDIDAVENIIKKKFQEENLRKKETIKWLRTFSKNIETVKIKSFDKLSLTGNIFFNQSVKDNKNWIILASGYGDNGYNLDTFYFIKFFYDLGFNVLAIDQRAYGKSEGEYTSLGYKERLDIKEWINYLVKRYPDCQIATWGISMGATTVLLACGEDLPSNFKICIADCPFDSFYNLLKYLSGHMIGFPSFLSSYILSGMAIVAKIRHNSNIKFSVKDYLKKAKVPILFFHGDNDTFVPYKLSEPMYMGYKNTYDVVLTKYAGHCMSNTLNYEKYRNSVFKFSREFMDFSEFDKPKDSENSISN